MNRLISTLCLLGALQGIWAPLDTLVGQGHELPRRYAPGPHPAARLAMAAMIEAGAGEGVQIMVTDGYRSYEAQASLVMVDPSNRALPGFSEHQLGTAFDLTWPGRRPFYIGQNEIMWDWLEENAHRFGFVISYPYKECSTWPYNNAFMGACGVEFKHEGWHVRYVGRKLAAEIFGAGYLDPSNPTLPQDFYQPLPRWLARYYGMGVSGEGTGPGFSQPLRRWPRGRRLTGG
jgi:hypothetical protein